ncbi:hypothetical protein F5X99DRAFT_118953 [Biscogniauxia marginata]|nr:hypothetical protein F5X99DRAFT_118953 [Biscogniauxia marginata]
MELGSKRIPTIRVVRIERCISYRGFVDLFPSFYFPSLPPTTTNQVYGHTSLPHGYIQHNGSCAGAYFVIYQAHARLGVALLRLETSLTPLSAVTKRVANLGMPNARLAEPYNTTTQILERLAASNVSCGGGGGDSFVRPIRSKYRSCTSFQTQVPRFSRSVLPQRGGPDNDVGGSSALTLGTCIDPSIYFTHGRPLSITRCMQDCK